jgi:hypothetical protein
VTGARDRLLLALASALIAAAAWAALPAAATAQEPLPVLRDLRGDLAQAAELGMPALSGLAALPSASETAAYAAGDVAVGVILLESNGRIDPDRETWSATRRDTVLNEVRQALAWWNAQDAEGDLRLFLPAAGTPGAPRTMATSYEPILRPSQDDILWRRQVMGRLGFSMELRRGESSGERRYADWLRRRTGADWAFVLYVVDSYRDPNGAFADFAIAYTVDLYGPYSVLTYDNDGYGIANFDAVLAHEMGHILGALDEYYPPFPGYPSTGDLTSGYLGVRNSNAVDGGTTDDSCIMRGSDEMLTAFRGDDVCTATQGQTGLRDLDRDGRQDVIDTQPVVTHGPQRQEGDGGLTVTGSIREQAWPRGRQSMGVYFRHDISILVPREVRYRVDGGAWGAVSASDGSFGEAGEGWTLTTPVLADGHHVLEVEGTTGETAGRVRDLWAGPTPVSLSLGTDTSYVGTTATITAGQAVRLYGRTTSAGLPVPYLQDVRIARVDGAGGPVLGGPMITTGLDGSWSGLLRPVRSSVYEARYAGDGQFFAPAPSAPVTVGVRFALTAQRPDGPYRRGDRVRVSGHVKPATPGLRLALEESRDGGATWTRVKGMSTRADSTYVTGYLTTRRGTILLRVRADATATNLGALKRVPAFVVR